jgi:hypothetical protein
MLARAVSQALAIDDRVQNIVGTVGLAKTCLALQFRKTQLLEEVMRRRILRAHTSVHAAHIRSANPFAERLNQPLPQPLTAETLPNIHVQVRRIIVKRRASPMSTLQPQAKISTQETHGLRMPQRPA